MKKVNNFFILLSYFFLGITALTNVASALFNKNMVHLSIEQLISIGIWTSLPWSAKILFSSVIDAVPIIGNQRKSYLVLASILGIAASLGMAESALPNSWLFIHLGEYTTLLLTNLFGTISVVITRLLFDVLIVENAIDEQEKASFQLYSRNLMIAGGLVGAAISGILASYFSIATIFMLSTISPLVILIISISNTYKKSNEASDKSLIGIGVLFLLISTILGLFLSDVWSQILVFLMSVLLFSYLLYKKVPHLENSHKLGFFITMLALFLFRTNPSAGIAATWYYMDIWHFDAAFLGTLSTIGYAASILSMVLFRNFLVKKEKLIKILVWTTLGLLILSLPDLMIYYGYNFGISAKHLILLDSAGVDALAQIAMIPLGIIVALNAPEEGKVTYFALTASLMNAALMLSSIITKFLNHIFVVPRGHYENLGLLLVWSLIISVGLSIIGIIILKFTEKGSLK
jgi:hypothetical protein